jgi:hypothetical protein
MNKNLCVLSLVLTATLGIASAPARADEQVNTQVTNQSAGVVGNGSSIYQQSDQLSVQQLKNMGRSGGSGSQDNLQQADQAAAAVGDRSYVEQRSNQVNAQQRSHRRLPSSDYYGH